MNNFKKTQLSYLLSIPKIADEAYLCFAEGNRNIPFEIKRFYYIFDIENGAVRGKHAHKKTAQFLFCIQGKVRIVLDNGKQREEIILSEPNLGVFIDKMLWHEMVDFQKNTILLIVASDYFEEKDYIRDYSTFLVLKEKIK